MSIKITTVAERAAYDFGEGFSLTAAPEQAAYIGRKYAFHHQYATNLPFGGSFDRLQRAFRAGYDREEIIT